MLTTIDFNVIVRKKWGKNAIDYRHFSGTNILFADAHVGWQKSNGIGSRLDIARKGGRLYE